jgi:H+/Cl- antiporter ClcA
MNTEQQDIHNSLKQALKKRTNRELSSNFTYRMMQQIRLEAEKQYLRKNVTGLLLLLTACLLLIGLAVYVFVFYVEFNLSDYLSYFKVSHSSSHLINFYSYIGLLTLWLLGMDYWYRQKWKNRQKTDKHKKII